MAKNKKQDRSRQQAQSSEKSAQEAQRSSIEAQSAQRQSQVTPGDLARKGKQKKFGHN
ncbi:MULTISPECIES: hypothetical protein [Streptomyces]|uniref:Small hydrophilic protein n=1 Tax=Streptomyces morookaense TaxID=1970 RepID=A0A7Y7B346_STRMO|nr:MULTISPECIES: hypothetical protein [Streptomyces]MCC2279351.1 hypothetical protein [Streptomyces sp. ET3-23]NVK78155.1 hypothetical protein [Streptomyces morookaense]